MSLTSKLPDVGITIFTQMTKLASESGAINLSQGFPDFDAHPQLIDLVEDYMRAGMNQYAPMQGVAQLRRCIAKKVNFLYGTRIDPEKEITITAGATEAIFAAISAVVWPGDEVIVVEPAYDAYVPVIQLNGGKPVFVPLTYPGYTMDWDRIRNAVTDQTRLIILNSPHNPTGTILNAEDLKQLCEVTDDKDLFILSDEVYEHIVFDNRLHQSMLRNPSLAKKSFVVNSFGKTYHTTGWKIGYCIAPEYLTWEFQKIHQFLTFTTNTPIQMAYADFMQHSGHYLKLAQFYQQKRDLFLDLMRPSRFNPLPCSGTYFQMMDYSTISDEADIDFARRLAIQHGVAAIPPSVFYHDRKDHKVLRFCFAKEDQTLVRAAELLSKI